MIHRRRDAVSEVPHNRSKLRTLLLSVVGAFLAFALAIPVANAAEVMRVTFVRHGQSYGNVSGNIDTKVPGPVLTPLGQQQAQDIVKVLGDNNYDAIYASTMVRTQQTATPMSQYLGLPIQVLPGLQEIEAGDYEGTPEKDATKGYLVAPIKWVQGDLSARIPGSIDGNEFESRVNGALQTMYDNGDRNPIVFSHGGTIMFWTMMNVTNLSLTEKFTLFATHPLTNTSYVVVEGNNEDGWVLVNWDGEEIGPQPTFQANVELQVRTVTRQLGAAVVQVTDSFASGDPATIATAVNRGVASAGFSVLKFGRAINAEVISRVQDLQKSIPQDEAALQQKVTTQVDNIKAAVNNTVGKVTQAAQDQDAVVASNTPKLASSLSAVKSKVKDAFKAQPGSTKSANEAGQKARDAVKKASDQVKSTVKKVSDQVKDAVKKATGRASDDRQPSDDKAAA